MNTTISEYKKFYSEQVNNFQFLACLSAELINCLHSQEVARFAAALSIIIEDRLPLSRTISQLVDDMKIMHGIFECAILFN